MRAIFDWANTNQGVLALLALLFGAPTLIALTYHGLRKALPTRRERETLLKNEFSHATELKKEIEAHVRWDDQWSYFGEFLIRDIQRRLPESDEVHSAVTTPHCIVVLTSIHSEFLEFTTGRTFARNIRQIGDRWFYCESAEEDALEVQTVFRLSYRDIAAIRWDTNDYWEWPQVCCRFTKSNKFPFSYIYFAKEKDLGPRKTLLEVCAAREVAPQPKAFAR